MAFLPHHPGRDKSIELASKVVSANGTIVVHDYNRDGEKAWCGKHLGLPSWNVDRLAIFTAISKQ